MATAVAPAPQHRMRPMDDPLAHLPRTAIFEYRKGRTIYGESQPSTGLYLILDGKVKICHTTRDGDQVVVDIYRTEQLFGESAFCDQSKRPETAIALADTRLMKWAISEIEDLIVRRPQLGMALFQQLVQRRMEFVARIESFSVDSVACRLARALVRFSERLGEEGEDGSVRMMPLTHEFLAQYVGTSREIVTDHMTKFRRRGYLRYSRIGIELYSHRMKDWLRQEPYTKYSGSAG